MVSSDVKLTLDISFHFMAELCLNGSSVVPDHPDQFPFSPSKVKQTLFNVLNLSNLPAVV